MENNNTQNNTQEKTSLKKSLTLKIYLILIVLIIGAGVYGYFWFQSTNKLRTEAEKSIMQAEQFKVLQTAVLNEQSRCEQFILQQEGGFSSFEYCKKFIDWSNATINIE